MSKVPLQSRFGVGVCHPTGYFSRTFASRGPLAIISYRGSGSCGEALISSRGNARGVQKCHLWLEETSKACRDATEG
jgi:hypothetical protein